MRKTKLKIIILFFCFIVILVLLGGVTQLYSYTEDNTVCYEATVHDVQIRGIGNNQTAEIEVEEYNNLFIAMNITKNFDLDKLSILNKGQKIFFRISDNNIDLVNNAMFVTIVSLNTEENDIFTLLEYNQFMENMIFIPKLILIVIALLLLAVLSVYIRRMTKERMSKLS